MENSDTLHPNPDAIVTARPIRTTSTWPTRAAAAIVLTASAGVLFIALMLTPNPSGLGTHQQLFPGPCGLLITSGLPCPTCGMTTAFAHTVRGQFLQAARAQPTGMLLCLATLLTAALAACAVIIGRWPRFHVPILTPYRLFATLLVLLLGGWAFKVAFGLANGDLPYR